MIDTDLKIILLSHQNNYIERSSMMNSAAKSFDILTELQFYMNNYFDSLTKLFSDLGVNSVSYKLVKITKVSKFTRC